MTENAEKRIAWIDVESNGKSPRDGSRLLQVACIITDADLNELHSGFDEKIFHSTADVRQLFAAAAVNVRIMHENTGLWDLLPEALQLSEVEEALLDYLKTYIPEEEGKWTPLGGNSITLDRDFLMTEMPSITDFLSYQSYDMSSVARHFRNVIPELPKFEKKYTHDALEDIRESIDEARYYRDVLKTLTLGGK
jgi:oligoribonuclease